MSKANTKHRNAPKQLANVLHGIVHRLGIARTVRKKNAVRVHSQNIFGGSFCGHHADFAVMIRKQPQDVLLDSEIERDDAEFSAVTVPRSEEHTSELQSPCNLVCRLLLEKKK